MTYVVKKEIKPPVLAEEIRSYHLPCFHPFFFILKALNVTLNIVRKINKIAIKLSSGGISFLYIFPPKCFGQTCHP